MPYVDLHRASQNNWQLGVEGDAGDVPAVAFQGLEEQEQEQEQEQESHLHTLVWYSALFW